MDLFKSVHTDITNIEALVESVAQVFARQKHQQFSLYELEADPWGKDPDVAKQQAARDRYASFEKQPQAAQAPGTASGAPKVAPPAPSIPVRDKTIVIVADKQGTPKQAGVFKGDQRGVATVEFGDQQTNHDKGFDITTNSIRPVRDDDAKALRDSAQVLLQKNQGKPVMVVQMN